MRATTAALLLVLAPLAPRAGWADDPEEWPEEDFEGGAEPPPADAPPPAADDDAGEGFEFEEGEDAGGGTDEVETPAAPPQPKRSPRPPDTPPDTPAPPPTIEAPKSARLGVDQTIRVEVEFQHAPKAPVLTSSVGRVAALEALGGNRYAAALVLPGETDQVYAVLSAWDDHQPGPPGLEKVRLAQPDGGGLRKGLRVAVVVVPGRLRIDWARPAQIYLLVHDHNGKAKDADVALHVERGKAGEPKQRAAGLYVADYTPPEVIGTAFDTVRASLGKGAPGWAELVIDGVRPAHVDVAAAPDPVVADGKSQATLTVRLAAQDGRPLSGHPVAIEALEGAVGPVKDNLDGTYTAAFTSPEVLPPTGRTNLVLRIGEAIPGEAPVTEEASVGLRAGPPAKASYVIEPRRVPADGATAARIYVTLVDATGNPAEGRPEVTVEVGGVVGEATSDTPGSWTVPWTPPAMPTLQFTRRSEVFVAVEGRRISAAGQLRVEPPAPEAEETARALASAYWAADLGFTTLFGEGFFGAASGVSLGGAWMARVADTAIYAGLSPGVTVLRSAVGARDDARMDEAFTGSVQAEVTQALAPLLATLSFQLQPTTWMEVFGGLGIGGLVAYAEANSDVAFGGKARSVSILGAVAAPVGIGFPVGEGTLALHAQYFRSIGDLAGAGKDEGVGVVGSIQAVSAGAGWRWSLW